MQSQKSLEDSRCRDDEQFDRDRFRHFKKDVLTMIQQKMIKVQQMKKKCKPKATFYSVLTSRLQKQLKNAKNHSSTQIRQKKFLLQRCKNQKHTRDTSRHSADPNKSKIHESTRTLFFRPTSSNSSKPKLNQTPNLKPRNARHRKFASLAALLGTKVDSIKQNCALENTKSIQLKQEFKAAHFYQELIDKNLSVILDKIV